MSAALFADSEGEGGAAVQSALAVRRAGAAGLTWLAQAGGPTRQRDPLTLPDEPLDAEATLSALVPVDLPLADRVAAATRFSAAISRAGLDALGTSGNRALAVLGSLGDGGGELLPLLARDEDPAGGAGERVARSIETTMEPGILPLVHHPDVEMRVQALAVLSGQTSDGAEKARIDALADPSQQVRRIALSTSSRTGASGGASSAASVSAVGRVLEHDDSWSMRVLAAEALGRMGAGNANASAMLAHAAQEDAFALVREAALIALVKVDGAAGKRIAADRATHDAEPRVRDTARGLARGS
jgi:hypothetical protein